MFVKSSWSRMKFTKLKVFIVFFLHFSHSFLTGLAYVEFKHVQSVPLAMGLTGQRILGRAIVVHHSQGDKNRHSEKLEQARQNLMKKGTGPYKVKVANLHPTVTEEQLKMISEPFGRIEKVQEI